jgi:hypothetical protein
VPPRLIVAAGHTQAVGRGRQLPVILAAIVLVSVAIGGPALGGSPGGLAPLTTPGVRATEPAPPMAAGPASVAARPAIVAAGRGESPSDLNPDCLNSAQPLARADELMANRYRLGAQPVVSLPSDPAWDEDPLGDANWQFQLHAMRYVLDLFTATRLTDDRAYRDRALFLLHDWTRDNPRRSAASIWAWNDHSTALRAVVLACAADLTPMTGWLHDALVLHGATLADDTFYRHEGNHALNQAIGLLEVARVLDRTDWRDLAGRRINDLIVASVDAEGVSNEQSVGYEDYNYHRYREAEARLRVAGLTPSPAFARVDLMPAFLAQATLPNGTYEQIGDTSSWRADDIVGTAAEFAATGGASGPKPASIVSRYAAGYLFARSGWGERRPFADETFLALKWGPAPVFHGHADGASLTLAAWGSRLLVDPGPYSYGGSLARTFFKGRSAHNVVTVDGAPWRWSAPTQLLGEREAAAYVDVRLRTAGYSGVVQTRRVTYLRGLDVLLVEDRASSPAVHTYRQLWHLGEAADPIVGVSTVRTQLDGGNVLIRQLTGSPALRIVTGATSPIQGWVSHKAGQMLPAPVVEAAQRGRSVRYLTLVVPAAGRPVAVVSGLRLTSTGYTVEIRIGARHERVTVSGSSVWVHELA